MTNELRQHATFFDRAESEYCLQNIPPMFVTVFHKAQTRNGQVRKRPRRREFFSAPGMSARKTRMEKDSMGEMSVPESALYGASTQRAVLNFPVSGWRFPRPFIRALGLLKWAAAQANHDLGLLDAERSALIVQAAEEVAEGKLDEHFPLDIFQTGSGTSTNTNANEVIANRCCQLAGKPIGAREPVHPNDHVNMGQSSNDVIPSAIHISAAEQLKHCLIPALEKLGRRAGRESDRIPRCDQDRSHPFDGRHAGPARPGIWRLCAASAFWETARRAGDHRVAGTRARRHRGRHRTESPSGVSRAK